MPIDRFSESVDNFLDGLDNRFYENYIDHLSNISPEKVDDFIHKKIVFKGEYLYLMGDKEKLLPILTEYGIAENEVRIIEISDIM